MSPRAGELTNGEHVTLHVFLKAARLNGTILLRGMGWAESTDAVYYHDYHRECACILGCCPAAQSHSCRLNSLQPLSAEQRSCMHADSFGSRA